MLRYHPKTSFLSRNTSSTPNGSGRSLAAGLCGGRRGQSVFRSWMRSRDSGRDSCHNAWRRPGAAAVPRASRRILRHLGDRFGGPEPTAELMVEILTFLRRGNFLVPSSSSVPSQNATLLQLNDRDGPPRLVTEETRFHCNVCSQVRAGVQSTSPCPRCHGKFVRWPDRECRADPLGQADSESRGRALGRRRAHRANSRPKTEPNSRATSKRRRSVRRSMFSRARRRWRWGSTSAGWTRS